MIRIFESQNNSKYALEIYEKDSGSFVEQIDTFKTIEDAIKCLHSFEKENTRYPLSDYIYSVVCLSRDGEW